MTVEILKTGDAKPRNIPVVDVKLDETVSVKPHPEHLSSFDAVEIQKAKRLSKDAQVAGPKAPIVWDPERPDKLSVPKFLVSSTDTDGTGMPVTVVGNYMILTPKLRSTHNEVLPFGSTYTQTDNTTAFRSYGKAFWMPSDAGSADAFTTGTQEFQYIYLKRESTASVNHVSHALHSTFNLETNQPFYVTVSAQDTSSTVKEVLKNNLKNQGWFHYSYAAAQGGGFVMSFGSYELVYYYQTNQVELYKVTSTPAQTAWTVLGAVTLPANDRRMTMTVYPIENVIYLVTGLLGSHDYDSSDVKSFPIVTADSVVNIQPTVSMRFWGPMVGFGLFTLTHYTKALLQSPAISIPYANPQDFMRVSCAGRNYRPSGTNKIEIDYGTTTNVFTEYLSPYTGKTTAYAKIELLDAQQDLRDRLATAQAAEDNALNNLTIAQQAQAQLLPSDSAAVRSAVLASVANMSAAYNSSKALTAAYKSKIKATVTQRYVEITMESREIITRPTATLYGLQAQATNFASPAISRIDYHSDTLPLSVSMNPNPQIQNSDVMHVSIREGVETSSCEVTLNNRYGTDEPNRHDIRYGRYTYPASNSNFCGVKPITVKIGYQDEKTADNPIPKFSGFVADRQYQRPGSATSTVTLTCQDRSKRLRETPTMMTPIYDGWCHLAVVYDLAQYAGLGDSEILFYQDPVTGKKIKKLSEVMDVDSSTSRTTKSGGCYDGHAVHGWPAGLTVPEGGKSFPGEYVHAKVSSTPEARGVAPQWMFAEGTTVWDCMQRVRQASRWLLFFNHWGNLIYCPPEYYMVTSPAMVFKEVPSDVGDFNEVQDGLNTTQSTEQSRNGVVVISAVPVNDSNYEFSPYMPYYKRVVNSSWPNNVADYNYVPWMRYYIERDPLLADPLRVNAYAQELYRRVCRPAKTISFSTWGNPEVFPYQNILFIEASGETGASGEDPLSGAQYIVSSVTHDLNAATYQYKTTIDAELFDPNYTFGPLDVKE